MAIGPMPLTHQGKSESQTNDRVKDSVPISGGMKINDHGEVMNDGHAEERGNVFTPTASTAAIPPSGSNPVPCGSKFFTASEEAQALYDQAADPLTKTVGFA